MPPAGSIKREMREWAKVTKPEGYEQSKVVVSTAQTLPQLYDEFFRAVRGCVDIKYTAEKGGAERGFSGHMVFVTPYLTILQDYNLMSQVDKVLDFCSGTCVGFGGVVTMQHYHPNFGNVPPPSVAAAAGAATGAGAAAAAAAASANRPIRHAPYPAFGLTIPTGDPPPEPLAVKNRIEKAKLFLELLYNTAATSSSDDALDSHGAAGGKVPVAAEDALAKTKAWVAAVRDGSLTDLPRLAAAAAVPEAKQASDGTTKGAAAAAVTATASEPAAAAFDAARATAETEVAAPVAPWEPHFDTVFQYIVSGSNSAEEVFADVFHTVGDLIAKVDEAPGGDEGGGTFSVVFVAPRFQTFNAEAWRKFGLTFGTALAQSPILHSFSVEMFHPELVCDGGVVSRARRSPFPVLHITHTGYKDQLIPPKASKPEPAAVAESATAADDAAAPATE
ncbi:unnamed protein product [Phaeothamnion confervicola]